MDALLVVDMQNACIEEVKRFRIEQVIAQINSLIGHFRSRDQLIVFIQHEDDSPEFSSGSSGWQIHKTIDCQPHDEVVAKSYNDAFIHTRLADLLQQHSIDRLVITGCATDFCVDCTIKGAIAQGYDVIVPDDAHTTADRPFVSAEKLIAHFNWNWAELMTVQQKIAVISTRRYLQVVNQ
ncbi:cysteine hydrolase family protein [Gynuella sunshinyii]|uniref:Amidases-like nicotinamidase n=1 Tax=Gynuella sunshinyii YC6258 TaxID=1445510 RepID=A0A0C5VPB4_9GAMM|nr:cysteine hydrolase family protein [Gynuella sunshinyii]AJQ96106.1 amidases-like nicotinamidase [Gynuella sunshinyii YC6258]